MAEMATCPCGWMVISPQGEEQAMKHSRMHMADVHPEASLTDAEIMKMIKSV
ncbi:MAG: hypothetical protein HY296_02595 [Thaumarchaeota archaeon]|nr:hypothetical protein [Nitrososphaerota archaeon]